MFGQNSQIPGTDGELINILPNVIFDKDGNNVTTYLATNSTITLMGHIQYNVKAQGLEGDYSNQKTLTEIKKNETPSFAQPMATDSKGNIIIVYSLTKTVSINTAQHSIYYSIKPPGSKTFFSKPKILKTYETEDESEFQPNPTVSYDGNDNAIIAWAEAETNSIKYRELPSGSSSFLSEKTIENAFPEVDFEFSLKFNIKSDSNGNILMVWNASKNEGSP